MGEGSGQVEVGRGEDGNLKKGVGSVEISVGFL